VLAALEGSRDFNARPRRQEVSLADLIVLAAPRRSRRPPRTRVSVEAPFTPAADASQEQTDAASFARWSRADGFRNYRAAGDQFMSPEEALVDRAQLLTLTAPEMTVLVGGLRVLGANAGGSKAGCSRIARAC
jgi:catalase-peroxidase